MGHLILVLGVDVLFSLSYWFLKNGVGRRWRWHLKSSAEYYSFGVDYWPSAGLTLYAIITSRVSCPTIYLRVF